MARIIDMARSGHGANQKATVSKKGGIESIDKSFSMIYTVVAESGDTPMTVANLDGIPQIGSIMDGLVCQRKTTSKKTPAIVDGEEKGIWTVTAEFSNELESNDPTEMPPEVRWTSEEYEEVLREDVEDQNKKVVTKCGEPLLLTIKRVIPVLTIKRTETAPFDPTKIVNYTNTVNSGAFWGAAAESALMAGIEANYKLVDTVNNGKKWFVDVTYTIKFRFEPNNSKPWKARILHAGTKYFPKAGAEAQKWMDVAGNTGTINLDANGLKLADNAAPVYLDFNVYRKVSWASLHINPNDLGTYFV